jgi:hypothetical protein
MITCDILIKELPDGTVSFACSPNQSSSTKPEREMATVFDLALQAASEYLLKKGLGKGSGGMVAGEGVKTHVAEFIKKHTA